MLKVGVVGVGHLGKEHARIYHQLPQVELVGVSDLNKKQLSSIARKYKTDGFSDYTDLIGKVDAVSVASPTSTHFEISKKFLNAGIHVLVEKPMTTKLEEAEELVEIANSKNIKLQVGHVERFNPVVMEVNKRNLQPVFIEAIRLSPFRFRSGDIGVVLDLMIHDLDIIQSLVKSEVERVDAVGINLLGKNEDMANVRISYKCGCVANITASRASLKSIRQIRLFSPDCYVSLDYKSMKGTIVKKPPDLDLASLNLQKSLPARFLGRTFEEIFFGKLLKVERLSMKTHEPLYKELESFVSCIEKDERPVVSGEDGLEAIRTADLIIKDIMKNLERAHNRFRD